MNSFTKQKLKDLDNNFMVTKGDRWGREIKRVNIYRVIYMK